MCSTGSVVLCFGAVQCLCGAVVLCCGAVSNVYVVHWCYAVVQCLMSMWCSVAMLWCCAAVQYLCCGAETVQWCYAAVQCMICCVPVCCGADSVLWRYAAVLHMVLCIIGAVYLAAVVIGLKTDISWTLLQREEPRCGVALVLCIETHALDFLSFVQK